MPTQKEDRSTQWTLDMDNQRWVLAKDAKITVSNAYGIYEGGTGSEIVVNGDIKAIGAEYSAIRFMASNSTVFVGEDSFIDARQARHGITADGASQFVENHGRIEAEAIGVSYTLWGSFENHGIVKATYGVVFNDGNAPSEVKNFGRIEAIGGVTFAPGGDNTLINGKKGVIDGDEYAVVFNSETQITNKGVIKGDIYSVPGNMSPDGQLKIINTGEIDGDISLGARSSVIDSLNGKIFGEITGSESGDIYMISQSKLKIVEQTGWGYDEVQSRVSYTLPQEIESLVLLGNDGINATGNFSNNDLHGNDAANKIRGLNGDDELFGNRGNDTLTGDLGMDTFYFRKGEGRDVITDFEDGVDHISLYAVLDPDDFDRLKIRQSGDDVVIDLGKGNQILLRDVDSADLSYADFSNA